MADRSRSVGGDARRSNLGAVVTLLHRQGPLSRAELTRRTALNRSTIAALVGELVDRGLIREDEATDAGGVGRPSPVVRLLTAPLVMTVNPDVDALTVAAVAPNAQVLATVRHHLPQPINPGEACALAAALIRDVAARVEPDAAVLGVAAAVPALVNRSLGEVTDAPHLGWRREPFGARLERATGLPSLIANDASLATSAEAHFGAGRGVSDFVYLNGSASGIGGGAVIAGQPLYGASSYAGELGHQVVNPRGRPCHCGRRGCLETEVERSRLLAALGLAPAEAADLEDHLSRPMSGAAAAELERQLQWLAIGVTNCVLVLNPERIIFGGFLAAIHRVASDRLDDLVRGATFPAVTEQLSFAEAALGPDLLAIGAAELWFDRLLADPAGVIGARNGSVRVGELQRTAAPGAAG